MSIIKKKHKIKNNVNKIFLDITYMYLYAIIILNNNLV